MSGERELAEEFEGRSALINWELKEGPGASYPYSARQRQEGRADALQDAASRLREAAELRGGDGG